MKGTELERSWSEATLRFADKYEMGRPDRSVLWDIISSGIERKAGLAGLLGLGEDNGFRLCFEIEETEEQAQNRLKPLVECLQWLENDGNKVAMIELRKNRISLDGGKNWRKLTRHLVPVAGELLGHCGSLEGAKHEAREALYRLLDYQVGDPALFGSRLGELLNAKSLWGVISCNWLDFISASENCSYQLSCYRPKPEERGAVNHFNGTIASWLDSRTLICTLHEQKPNGELQLPKKVGRAWAQAECADVPWFIWGREYGGGWTQHTRTMLREPILQAIRELYGADRPRWTLIDGWRGRTRLEPGAESLWPGYFDIGDWKAFRLRGFPEPGPFWYYHHGVCWSCGEETNHGARGVCEDCDEPEYDYYCESCGDGINSDNVYSASDTVFCQDCFGENYFYCASCSEATANDNGTYVESEGETYCERCLDRHFDYCDNCEQYYRGEGGNTVDGYRCDECLGDYSECAECGDVARETTETVDGAMCKDCFANYDECEECGDYHEIASMEKEAGALFCAHCFAALEVNEEELFLESEAA